MPESQTILLGLGQCGIQQSMCVWETLCKDYDITLQGNLISDDVSKEVFFDYNGSNFVPRVLLIDYDPIPFDVIRNSTLKNLFRDKSLISGNCDSAGIYSRGYDVQRISKRVFDRSRQEFRVLTEATDRLVSLTSFYAVGGGFGSGFASRFYEALEDSYTKLRKANIMVVPCDMNLTCCVEPINTVLSFASMKDLAQINVLTDNAAMTKRVTSTNLKQSSYVDLNFLTAGMFANVVGTIQGDLVKLATNLVPFPPINMVFPNISGLYSINRKPYACGTDLYANTYQLISKFHNQSMLTINSNEGLHLSCSVQIRGSPRTTQLSVLHRVFQAVERNEGKQFVTWTPGFNTNVGYRPLQFPSSSNLLFAPQVMTSLVNHTALKDPLEYTAKTFDRMMQFESYQHWYRSLEKQDFEEARETFQMICDTYDLKDIAE